MLFYIITESCAKDKNITESCVGYACQLTNITHVVACCWKCAFQVLTEKVSDKKTVAFLVLARFALLEANFSGHQCSMFAGFGWLLSPVFVLSDSQRL